MLCITWVSLLLGISGSLTAWAQVPLFLANEQTTIRGISFDFASTRTFEEERLFELIATQGPGFWDGVKRVLPFFSAGRYPLDRVEIQRDVIRLRQFYLNNGFITPSIDYAASRLDTARNAIQVVFSIDEGQPLIIQDVGFFNADGGYVAALFEGDLRDQWIRFRDRTSFKTGDRYTHFDMVRIQDQVLSWIKDHGFAFARLDPDVYIDSTYYTADISFVLKPGPRGYINKIEVEGNTLVSDHVVRRALPFKEGDPYSNKKLIQGQQQLFGLNLFRLALAEVPPQPEDSAVTVRYTVREAKLRRFAAQPGYSFQDGVSLQGQWGHRNFLGAARSLTVSVRANTGFFSREQEGTSAHQLIRGSVSIHQPHLFVSQLSGIFSPFVQVERDPLLLDAGGINRREVGVTTSLIYTVMPFRFISASHEFSDVFQRSVVADSTKNNNLSTGDDAFPKSILGLSSNLGKVDNFINPQRGFLFRPLIEQAGGVLPSGVEYFKVQADVIGFIPIRSGLRFVPRLRIGWYKPFGQSRDQFTLPTRDRFSQIRFKAGGASDVRGWATNLAGPKFPRPVNDERSSFIYDPIGGVAKLSGSIETQLQIPGFSSLWHLALFLDFGQVSGEVRTLGEGGTCNDDETAFEEFNVCLKDTGRLAFDKFKVGTGMGIRYLTPVGFVRFDLGLKLNPDDLDLQSAEDAYRFIMGELDSPNKKFLRRFGLHLTIGQTF